MLCSRCPTPLSKRLYDPARQTAFASDYCGMAPTISLHGSITMRIHPRDTSRCVADTTLAWDGHGPFQLVARIGVRNIRDYFRSAPSTRVQ